MAWTFALIAPVHPILHRVSWSYEMIPNAPNDYTTHQNISLGSNGADWVRSLRKIPTRLHGTILCTSPARFAPSLIRQPNGPECTQIVRDATKCKFKVRWSVSGAFVANNYDATSWHELLHKFSPFCTEFRKATKRSRMHPNSTKCTKTSV